MNSLAFVTRTLALTIVAALMCTVTLPAHVDAQVWKKIKEQTEKKVDAWKARADSAATTRAGQTVDSTLAKTERGVDTAMSKAAAAADAVVNKTEEIVSSAAGALGGNDDEKKLAAELQAGRAVLAEVSFVGTTEQLAEGSEPHLERLAKLLKEQSGTFLIEGHVEDSRSAPANQALSEKRSTVVKALLVAAGVSAERLFAMGFGATRPPTDAKASWARIEVARMK